MSILKLIIQREFIAKVRNKSFIVMTFLSPLLFIGVSALIGYLSSMKADLKKIAIHDETGIFINEFKSNEEYKYLDYSNKDLNFIRESVIKDSIDGVLLIPTSSNKTLIENKIEFISNESPSSVYVKDLEKIIDKKITQNNYVKASLDTLAITKANSNIAINLSKASGEASVKGLNEIKVAIGGACGYLIMMFLIIYGNMVMRSVIEEKTNRIIEIIISSVKPFQLMMGKIIGTSLAGVLQFTIWVILAIAGTYVFSSIFGLQMKSDTQVLNATQSEAKQNMQQYFSAILDLPIATILVCFILYFVLGYFLYSSFYAAIGAAVDNETDTQQFMMPIIMPLVLAVYIGFFTVIHDPHGTIAVTFSMIPLTSPIVMMMRIPFGVPWWQILISLAILFVTFLGVVWFAGKIYRIAILIHGKKPTWKEIFKWLRY